MPSTNETFHGFVETTTDTLLIFEACRRGIFPKINRRLQERERGAVQSGTVFVFDERESGIKRWTDGFVWSPSRILGNFLIYRELDGRDSTTDKRRANRMSVGSSSAVGYSYSQVNHQEFDDPYQHDPHNDPHSHPHPHPHSHSHPHVHQDYNNSNRDMVLGGDTNNNLSNNNSSSPPTVDRSRERALVGSLTTSYNFKKGGLIKKTMSIVVNGSPQHLISYYTKEDVLNNRLPTPSSIPELAQLEISPDLLLRQSFRIPPMTEHTAADMMFDTKPEFPSPRALALSPYPMPRQQLRRRASEYSEPMYARKSSKTGLDGNSIRAMTLDNSNSPFDNNNTIMDRGGIHGGNGNGMATPTTTTYSRGGNNNNNNFALGNRGPMVRYNTAPEPHELTGVCDPMGISKCTPMMPVGYPAVADMSSPQSATTTVFMPSPTVTDPRPTATIGQSPLPPQQQQQQQQQPQSQQQQQQSSMPYHLQVPIRTSRQLSLPVSESPTSSTSPPPSPFAPYGRPIPRKLPLEQRQQQQQNGYWQQPQQQQQSQQQPQRTREDVYREDPRFSAQGYGNSLSPPQQHPSHRHHHEQHQQQGSLPNNNNSIHNNSSNNVMLFSEPQQSNTPVPLEATKIVTPTVIDSKPHMVYASSPQVHHPLTAPKDFHHPMQQSSQLEYY